MVRRTGAIVAAAALLSSPVRAEEAPPSVPIAAALHVEPNECFDAASLAPVLSHWLRRDTVDRRIDVEVRGRAGGPEGVVLRVRRDGRVVGERRFLGLSAPCEEVRAAVGLAAALAVDATLVESLGVPPALVLATSPPPAPAPQKPPKPPDRWPGVSASIDAVALFGVLPSPVAAVAPGLGVRPASPVELRFSGLFTATGSLALDRWEVGVRLFAGRADVCAVLPAGIARLRGCVGVAAGTLQATTTGPRVALSPEVPWAAAAGRADARVSLRPWFGFVLGAEAIFPFTRPRFLAETAAGAQVAANGLPAAGGAVTIGPEVTFR